MTHVQLHAYHDTSRSTRMRSTIVVLYLQSFMDQCTGTQVPQVRYYCLLENMYLAKINDKLWPLKIGSSDASRKMIKYA